MKRTMAVACIFAASVSVTLAQEWKPAGDKILTTWGENIDSNNVYQEYPRPQLKGEGNWQNLNGLWKYKITAKDQSQAPTDWDGDILVPFAVESALSGVGKSVGKDQALWYNSQVKLTNKQRKGDRVLLHFGAVDWQCDVYIN